MRLKPLVNERFIIVNSLTRFFYTHTQTSAFNEKLHCKDKRHGFTLCAYRIQRFHAAVVGGGGEKEREKRKKGHLEDAKRAL